MSRKHDAALVGLVTQVPALSSRFYPGLAPKGATVPYAVYWTTAGADTIEREAGPYRTANPQWTIHAVGSSPDQAQAINEAIKSKLIVNGFGVVPSVDGERPGAFWFRNPVAVDRDDDADPPLFWATAECGFHSDF